MAKSKKSKPDHNGGREGRVKMPEHGSFLREYRENALRARKPARTEDRDAAGRFQPSQKEED